MAAYPSAVPSIASNKGDATETVGDHAAHHNQLAQELVAIATELGVNPSGAAADVVSRLNTLASDLSSLQSTVGASLPCPDASTLVKGVSKLSTAPASATNPIAVGDNDPRMTNARTPTAHTHPQSDVTNLVSDLAGKAATSHTHAQADITGLVAALAAKFAWTAVVKQAADLSNSTTTPSNTDLVFSFAANGVYAIDLYLLATSGATTTGYGFAFDTSVAVTTVALHFEHVLANAGTISGGNSIADNTPLGLSSGVNAANTVTPIMGTGLLVAGANAGTARLTFRPEVAAAAVFKANSVMRVHQVA